MARIYPQKPDPDTPGSEKKVFYALKEDLPDSYIVLHSRRFLKPGVADDRAQEGEIDFVILSPGVAGWGWK